MNNVKNIFSIKDLEQISGIKAHTIRIWEKRYGILTPMRSETNIRNYDLASLQKLLNITLLLKYGYKISRIALAGNDKIPEMVREIISAKSVKHHAISSFKIAMLNFDQALFLNTYNTLLSEKTFPEVFYEIFIPLMEELGLLWQSETITPAHEHFITHLIKQKVISNTEKFQIKAPTNHSKVFVLYLPSNEIHELGLLYLNYEIAAHGYKCIYLGESVPTESLKSIAESLESIIFVSYFTVEPQKEDLSAYLTEFNTEILNKKNTELWLLGRMTEHIEPQSLSSKTTLFKAIDQLVDQL